MYAGWPVRDYLHWMAAVSQRGAFQSSEGFVFLYASFTFVVHQLCSPPARPETCVFQVYVLKRPHVDEFLQKMGELFECVLFTASLAKVFLFLLWIFAAGRTAFCVSWLWSAFALSPSEFSHFLLPSLSICV